MAIAQLDIRVHARGQGHSTAAAVAYRFAVRLTCERTGQIHDYTRRARGQAVAATGFTHPALADPGAFADTLENAERRRNSQLLRDVVIALPHELDDDARAALTRDFAADLAERYGTACAWAVHRPDRRGDTRNHHAHVLLPTRAIDATGTPREKLRALNDKRQGAEEFRAIRGLWESACNQHLKQAGIDARISTARRTDRAPQPTLGPECTAAERRRYRENHGRDPRDLSAAETARANLDDDDVATERGRAVAEWSHRNEAQRAVERDTFAARESARALAVASADLAAAAAEERAQAARDLAAQISVAQLLATAEAQAEKDREAEKRAAQEQAAGAAAGRIAVAHELARRARVHRESKQVPAATVADALARLDDDNINLSDEPPDPADLRTLRDAGQPGDDGRPRGIRWRKTYLALAREVAARAGAARTGPDAPDPDTLADTARALYAVSSRLGRILTPEEAAGLMECANAPHRHGLGRIPPGPVRARVAQLAHVYRQKRARATAEREQGQAKAREEQARREQAAQEEAARERERAARERVAQEQAAREAARAPGAPLFALARRTAPNLADPDMRIETNTLDPARAARHQARPEPAPDRSGTTPAQPPPRRRDDGWER